MKTGKILMVLLLMSALLLSACAQTPTPPANGDPTPPPTVYNFRLGSKMVDNHLESQAVTMFIELAKERSNGRINIVPFFGAALGDDKVQMENVMSGLQDFYVESYTTAQSWQPGFRVHTLPYLFASNEEYREFLLSDIQEELEAELVANTKLRIVNESKNWLRGPYRVLITRRPVAQLSDIAGMKIRQPDATGTVRVWRALGSEVVLVPYSECYLALQQGMMDGLTVPLGNLYSDKFIELATNVAVTMDYFQQVAIYMNDDKYQSLPEDLRVILHESLNEAGDFLTNLINTEGVALRQRMIDEYKATFYDLDLDPWLEVAKVVHKEIEAEGFVPAGLIDRINAHFGR